VVVRKDRTSFLTWPQFKPSIDARVTQMKKERDVSTSKFDRGKLEERISALSGGVAQIMIGAATETEQKSKRLRYEDAINAVRAALDTGYVPGGGVTYLAVCRPEFEEKVLKGIEDSAREEMSGTGEDNSQSYAENVGAEEMESEIELQKQGAKIVLKAMKSITRQIANNAGVNGDRVVDTILQTKSGFGFGWNAKTSRFGDMIKMGVIDPAKVIVAAIENSASVAGLVLTTEGMMVEEEKDEDRTKVDSQPGMMDED